MEGKSKKTISLLITIIFVAFIITIIAKYYLNIEKFDFELYSDQKTSKQVEKLIKNQKKWVWLAYASIPILIVLRTSLVSLCLSIGVFFYNMEHKLSFKHFFRISLFGEFVLIFVGLIKLLYFLFVKTDYNLQDLQQYYPLSYINFLEIEKLQPWLIYPLQTINLFELAYFLVLAYGLNKLLKNKFWKSLEITAVSYGTGLVIWMGMVMFLTLNIS